MNDFIKFTVIDYVNVATMDNEKDMREPSKEDHEVSSDDSQDKIVDEGGNQKEEDRPDQSVEQDHSTHDETKTTTNNPVLENNEDSNTPVPGDDPQEATVESPGSTGGDLAQIGSAIDDDPPTLDPGDVQPGDESTNDPVQEQEATGTSPIAPPEAAKEDDPSAGNAEQGETVEDTGTVTQEAETTTGTISPGDQETVESSLTQQVSTHTDTDEEPKETPVASPEEAAAGTEADDSVEPTRQENDILPADKLATAEDTPGGDVENVGDVSPAVTAGKDIEETVVPGGAPQDIEQGSRSESEKKGEGKGLSSEEDLSEKDAHDEHEDEHEEVDYTTLSKEELVELIKSLAKDDNVLRSDRIAKQIKPLFDEIKNSERAKALERFLQDEGNAEEDFEYKYDELVNRFDANYKLIKDRKSQYTHEKEQQKEANLIKKQEILERLREFVDADDPNVNFDDFKKIQDEWKNVGPIPGAHVKTLWANYNALVDRFYDNRSIYFELKELDRRKNLEAKLELCERAEKLSTVDHIKDAITELNELHHEFKHIGPVPKDDQEAVWQRFKAASDAVYDRRKGFVEQLKQELDANLKVKEELAEAVQPFTAFDSDRIKEWNSKTKELLDIQRKWEATGGLPRNKAKEVNKRFWGAFKTFFNNKGNFFKKLDAQRVGNMEEKRELVKKAQELKDSEDWNKTADEFKELQRKWKEIGPVPEKYRESIYQEFKQACDHFFDNRRKNHGQVEKEFEENYEKKLQVCAEISTMADVKSEDIEKFRDLQEAFNDIGFVPRRNISEIKTRYAEAVEKYINSLEHLSGEEKQSLRAENQINRLIGGPNAGQKIHRKEQSLRKQISQVENDIAVWKNNLEFFAQSKKADKLKDEFQSKINSANNQLKNLKQQLKILRTVS